MEKKGQNVEVCIKLKLFQTPPCSNCTGKKLFFLGQASDYQCWFRMFIPEYATV